MAIDGKYGRVTFERENTIGEDEPVFVFRAQDELLLEVLNEYQRLAMRAGSPKRHLDAIEQSREQIEHWQANNTTQVPQSASWTPEGR